MGRKRKVSSRPDTLISTRPESTKLVINSVEDVADSEDEFLSNRDRISLEEGREAKRRRKAQEEDQLLEPSDEEMLAYPSSDDDESLLEDGARSIDNQPGYSGQDSTIQSRNTTKEREGVEDQNSDDWGESRQDYYGADNIDTEQAALEEEAEAKRLQWKQLEGLADLDAQFDLSYQEEDGGDGSSDDDNVVTETLPELDVPESASVVEREKLLQSRYPELSSIAKDWLELHKVYEQVLDDANHARRLSKLQTVQYNVQSPEQHPAVIRYTALSAYLTTCAMYFAVLTSTADSSEGPVLAMGPKKLREHAVIQSILETRQLWEMVKDLPRPDVVAELAALEQDMVKETTFRPEPFNVPALARSLTVGAKSKEGRTKPSRGAEAAQAADEVRRSDRMLKVNADLADLDELTTSNSKRNKPDIRTSTSGKLIINEDDSDLGDETELNADELAAKSQRKKSLKFYTSQIAQKANKQNLKGREAGGDADIPYRERLRDREARLNAAAERRGRQALAPGEELGDSSGDDITGGTRVGTRNQDTDEQDYYDLIVAKSKQKKADKVAAASADIQARLLDARGFASAELGHDDKRKLTYNILKNKGLTPHRKKDVRNPRVKKKLKYESKLKKLGSVKQVYKGGEGRGGYGGELSGIKTGLVKSIKM